MRKGHFITNSNDDDDDDDDDDIFFSSRGGMVTEYGGYGRNLLSIRDN